MLIIDPLDFGGDTTGETMTSDFAFTIVGAPVYTFGGGVVIAAAGATEEQRELETSGSRSGKGSAKK